MLVSTLGDADIIKHGIDEGSGLVLYGGSFDVTCIGNLEYEGTGEGDPMVNP